jgi:hypothetical protein
MEKIVRSLGNLFLVYAVLSCLSMARAQGSCYEDTGSFCYVQCGIVSNNGCYANAKAYSEGSFGELLGVIVRCGNDSAGVPCVASGFAINFCAPLTNCQNEDFLGPRVAHLQKIVPGAPIFSVSCAGGLGRADIEKPPKSGVSNSSSIESVLRKIDRGLPISISVKGAQR